MIEKYLLAEYCRGPFYMGWWMYVRDTNDGHRNADGGWGWTERGETFGIGQHAIWKFCKSLGNDDMPESKRWSDKFAEWFAGKYPAGLHVRLRNDADGWAVIELIEVVKDIPKQQKGVIRTVRAANISFGKACAAHRRETQKKNKPAVTV